MDQALQFARGPLFTATFLFMVLSLLRLVLLNAAAIPATLKNTNDKYLNKPAMWRSIIDWLIPIKHVGISRPVFTVVSFLWHAAMISVPLLLIDHLLLWQRGTGIPWPDALSFSRPVADVLTIVTITLTAGLVIYRWIDVRTRALSEPMDYIVMLAILVPFATGFMAAHPAWNPVPYSTTMLVHVLGAELVFVLMPITKLAHAALFPFGRISTEVYWKFPEGSGEAISYELHGEDAPV